MARLQLELPLHAVKPFPPPYPHPHVSLRLQRRSVHTSLLKLRRHIGPSIRRADLETSHQQRGKSQDFRLREVATGAQVVSSTKWTKGASIELRWQSWACWVRILLLDLGAAIRLRFDGHKKASRIESMRILSPNLRIEMDGVGRNDTHIPFLQQDLFARRRVRKESICDDFAVYSHGCCDAQGFAESGGVERAVGCEF